MQQSNHSLTRNKPLTFATLTVLGIAALLLGLALIVFAHYHERAYVFLVLGAGGIIGGIAGIIGVGPKVKVALSYGVIALGMMGIIVGINYLADRYGPAPNVTHGGIVIILSIIALLVGIVGALTAQSKGGMITFLSVIMLGVIASLGIVVLTVGTIYLVVLQSQGHAYLLLGMGALCLIGGIACGIYAQSKMRRSANG
ncbi:MAG: hypothetical protein NVS4B12_26290 [Ktedonobacteraceae bacterium]